MNEGLRSPSPSRMDLCLEYVWGERRNKDGEKAHANRIQFGLNFGF